MRAYKVETSLSNDDGTETIITQFAGTQADATHARQVIVNDHGVKKSEVEIKEVDIPTDKTGLLAFINDLVG